MEWTDCSRVTPLGGLAYFGHFLHANGLFDELVAGCPLSYSSNNAPSKRQVLGTAVCAILKGARRYAHVSHIHGDTVCAETLGSRAGLYRKIVCDAAFARGRGTIGLPGIAG